MFHAAVRIRIDRDLTDEALNQLRPALRLSSQGRLTDDWDQIFGSRTDDLPEGRIKVALLRADTGGPWTIQVSTEGTAPPDAVRAVVNEIARVLRASAIGIIRLAVPTDADWNSS